MNQGAEPVLTIRARTFTFSLQSEIIGATALGVRNVLCVTGESGANSLPPHATHWTSRPRCNPNALFLRRMRDEGKYLDGV